MSQINFTLLLDLLGTFAFAISGIRLASGKQIDWFGAYIVGLVTAIGGGTTRDLLLGVTPFWMLDAHYFLTTGVALVFILLFKDKLFKLGSALFLFDVAGNAGLVGRAMSGPEDCHIGVQRGLFGPRQAAESLLGHRLLPQINPS
jgi:uncharacterized membrane protein YeiH